MHHIKKGFDCKKTGFVLRLQIQKKAVFIKTGFAYIKKGFSHAKKTKEKKSFSSNRSLGGVKSYFGKLVLK